MAVWRYKFLLSSSTIVQSLAALTREVFFNIRSEVSYLRAAV